MADLTYRSVRLIMRTVLRLFSTWRVEGLENIPPYGPLLVVANHVSNIDPPLLAASLTRRLHFHAKRSIFTPLTGRLLRAWGAFPVDRDGQDLDGYRWARRLLDRDKVLAMFPETTRSLKGMQKAVPGVAMLALHTQAPILPVGIEGTAHLGPYWRVATPTGRITLRVGQPFTLPSIEGRLGRAQLQSLADMVMYRIAPLVPEDLQGVYRLKTRGNAPPPEETGS